MKPRKKQKPEPKKLREQPVYVKVGTVVRRDGVVELRLDSRVNSLNVAGPPWTGSQQEDTVPF